MKEYIKPIIEDEVIVLEDVIAASLAGEGDASNGGQSGDFTDYFED